MITLRSKALKATLAPLGARLSGLWIDGWPQSLVLGPPDTQTAQHPDLAFFGVVVGPIANRVTDATVELNGKVWKMDANEGTTALHSGLCGMHAQVWDIASSSSDEISFALTLPHGACGLPGHRRVSATYKLTDSCIELDIRATSDTPTAMNLAHHPYWNLNGEATVAGHELQVAATHVLPVDDLNLPTGEISPVMASQYDFRTPKTVPVHIPLDANLCLATARRSEPRFAARLTAPNGPVLEIETTEPGLQVYNGFGLPTSAVPLHPGQRLQRCAGIALEPQGWPDAPRHTAFPSIMLKPGDEYHQLTRYQFS